MKTFPYIMLTLRCGQGNCAIPAHDLEKKVKVTKTWYVLDNVLYKHIPRYENIPSHIVDSIVRTTQITKWPPVTLIIRSRSPKLDTTSRMSYRCISPNIITFHHILLILLCGQGIVWRRRRRRRRRRTPTPTRTEPKSICLPSIRGRHNCTI